MGESGRSDPLPLQQYRRLKYYIPLVIICFTTKKLDIIEVGIIRQELAKHPVLPIYAYLYHMELLFLGGSLALPVPPNKQQGSGVNLSSQKINRYIRMWDAHFCREATERGMSKVRQVQDTYIRRAYLLKNSLILRISHPSMYFMYIWMYNLRTTSRSFLPFTGRQSNLATYIYMYVACILCM